jgi:hypothetical protein
VDTQPLKKTVPKAISYLESLSAIHEIIGDATGIDNGKETHLIPVEL